MGTGFDISRNVAMKVVKRVTNFISANGRDKIANKKYPQKLNIDEDLRALYHNAFPILFPQATDQILTPDFTTRQMIGKMKRNIFPLGTRFDVVGDDDKRSQTAALQKLLKGMRWRTKIKQVVEESALMGYCGIRTTWSDERRQWITVVKTKEELLIEKDPINPDEYAAISIFWKTLDQRGQCMWHKERWTVETYERWVPLKGTEEAMPDFKDKPLEVTEPNNYGLIPITIVAHETCADTPGKGMVRSDDILAVKAMIRLLNNRHDAHNKFLRPAFIRYNHQDPDQPVSLASDAVIDLTDNENGAKADAKLLDFKGVPDSAKQEMLDWADNLYINNGLTPPSQTKEFMAGGVVKSGVALMVLNQDEVDTIESLREDGYAEVGRHVEKIILMAKALGGEAEAKLGGIKVADDGSQGDLITITYPPIYSPSDDERLTRVTLLERSNLPNDKKAKLEAEVFGIDDENVINEIESRWDDKDKAMEPTNPNAIGRGF